MAIAQQRTQQSAHAAPPKPQRVSMSPETFTSGGLINDIDVTFTDAQTTTWDMNGAVSPDTPFLAVEMTDGNGAAHIQYYSAGKPEDWQPEESGEGFVSNSGKTGVNSTTNLGMFLSSLVDAGFPTEMLADGNLKAVIGTQAHVLQKVLERQGLVRTGKNASRPNQVLLVSKIIALPGAGAGAGAGVGGTKGKAVQPKAGAGASASKTVSGKPNGQAANANVSADGDALANSVYKALRLHLAATGEPIPVKDMPKVTYAYYKAEGLDQKEANKAVALCGKQSFRATLGENGIEYDADAGTVALVEGWEEPE